MKQSLYLAYRYFSFHKFRSAVLIASIGIVTFLPNGLQRLIVESEKQMMARAESTPLIVGAKGSSTDLVINTLYFQQEKTEEIAVNVAERLTATDLGYSIPVFCAFRARGFPIVSTSLDYLNFRQLRIEQGRNLSYVGDCVVGARVAGELGLLPGDSLISSPENFFDLAGVYPLKMRVVGILAPSDTPDDKAVFTDLKTGWVILGLGHGHEDLANTSNQSVILNKSDTVVTANAKLYIYNQITGDNLESFHFHGDTRNYPITSILFVPNDTKSEAILRGRFEAKELPHQAVVPSNVVENLLQSIFRIKEIFNTVFLLVGLATLLILALIVTLSLRLRKGEIFTMFTIGSSRGKMAEILGFELLIIIGSSALFAFFLYYLTGFFVEEFITHYIL
jgi:putative ABC transport system permease protein